MSCERHATAIAGVAAGMPASAELEAHLAGCTACRAALAELREALAVADGTLAELAVADPSPDLRARIRQAMAAESETAWGVGGLGRRWAFTTAAAVLVIAVVVVVGGRSRSGFTGGARTALATVPAEAPAPVHPAAPASGARTSAAGGTLSGRSTAAATTDLARSRRPLRVAVDRRVRPALRPEPQVLVPPGQEQALLQLVAFVHGQRATPAALSAVGQPSADLPQPQNIEIKPLEIVPLDPAESAGT